MRLEQNDGKQVSPVAYASAETYMAIDQADQATPDNWIPRSQDCILLTGRHPLNAEPKLNDLFDAGLVTPNALHYVRNHGAVPRLFWETHKVDIENGTLVLSMNELKARFTDQHPSRPSLRQQPSRRAQSHQEKQGLLLWPWCHLLLLLARRAPPRSPRRRRDHYARLGREAHVGQLRRFG